VRRALLTFGLLMASTAAAADDTWRFAVGAGYDAYVHNYYLADTDTTAAIQEANVTVGFDGRSPSRAAHQWFLRGEVSTGTELTRELLDASYRWRPGEGEPRVRADLTWFGRQYRPGSEYSLVSDNQDGKAELRVAPWAGRGAVLEARALGRWLDYRTPSTLEQDYREGGGAIYLRAPTAHESRWEAGLRATRRSYPDSAAIDRDVVALDLSADRCAESFEFWGFHRSERRLIADETVRPSAWSHWTDLSVVLGHLTADLASEVWRYDQESFTYVDSWRTELDLGYRWGDPLLALWQASLTGENLAAGESPETYAQAGVRGSVESYLASFAGSLAVEVGRRWYRQDGSELEDLVAYSDFTYLEVWLLASLHVAANLTLDVTASYEPESHTEQDDDVTLGFGSVSLVWRR